MAGSLVKLQASLTRDYYKYFSKYANGKTSGKKIAWVTAFTPVEILEALEIAYYYPESYAAVIAASGREQELLRKSEQMGLCRDCCSYSCCIEGCLELEEGPRGVPPTPDVLIATNNQCNTLPGWWNILADRYGVQLIVLDYPGEGVERQQAYEYVTAQYKRLIDELEKLSGNTLDEARLEELIHNSTISVEKWNEVVELFYQKAIKPTVLFDDMSFLITSRCKEETGDFYELLAEKLGTAEDVDRSLIPVFWLGYPLWYHQDRYLSELLEGFRVAGANYITWWSLDYSGDGPLEKLFSAYNYTFLNLSQSTRTRKLSQLIKRSGAVCAVTLHNKSCKCDFVSAREIGIPQAELEIDMIDREHLSLDKAKAQIDLLKDTVCSTWE